jgi:hypothetical protein
MNEFIEPKFENPIGYEIDYGLLQEFESNLDPINPESCQIPCRVLGYGEMSTVFEIKEQNMQGLAFKRMSIFEYPDELEDYLITYLEYHRKLEDEIGINLPPNGYAVVISKSRRPIFYIIQEKIQPTAVGNQAIHLMPVHMVEKLTQCVLRDLLRVWKFNLLDTDCCVGLDGQISNWVIKDFDADQPCIEQDTRLCYIDTSTPLMRLNGEEQLDTELFLRPAPSFLAWILRLFIVQDVLDRYYDFRKVVIDILANFYKEQRPDLIPPSLQVANKFFSNEASQLNLEPIEEEEISSYYKEDAFIWELYLSMRRLDRFLYRHVFRRDYPYILPKKIKR